jgi:hypothetical protein
MTKLGACSPGLRKRSTTQAAYAKQRVGPSFAGKTWPGFPTRIIDSRKEMLLPSRLPIYVELKLKYRKASRSL